MSKGKSARDSWRLDETRRLSEELLDRAVGGGPMSWRDWDELTWSIASVPGLALAPSRLWNQVAQRLLVESHIADGVPWMVRAEAYHRLITHPVGGRRAIAVAAESAADRGAQSMIGMLAAFSATADPMATTTVLRHITDPVTERTFYGALLTAVKVLDHGHLDPAMARAVLPTLVDLISDGGELALLAASLLRRLPAEARGGLSARLLREVACLVEVPARPQLPDSVVAELAGVAGALADPLLPVWVTEMTRHPVFDIRLLATFHIYASPLRIPLARALAADLECLLRARASGTRVHRLFQILRKLGGPEQRRMVERLLTHPELPATVLDSAAYSLGHLGGHTPANWFRQAVRHHLAHTREPAHISVLDRLVYAMGMSGHDAVLTELLSVPDLPNPVRTAARWWLELPTHIRESART
ncbi:hypothetical protein JOD54_003452 [Actinokineospora baliensis]|uniref:hypothetical protein n=1 Tax=Actinokineospora baliensis TaxID=547056 RepID=UPI00195BC8C0|nr:hypothetical protein [Actinokineospora baliensis]MBM7773248.1 hypothetical protein [Actinokineospora baliensis]